MLRVTSLRKNFCNQVQKTNKTLDQVIRNTQIGRLALEQFIDTQKTLSNLESKPEYTQMVQQSQVNKNEVDRLLAKKGARPSFLLPIVYIGARLAGAASLLLGKDVSVFIFSVLIIFQKSLQIAVTAGKVLEDYTDESLRILSEENIDDQDTKNVIKKARDQNYTLRHQMNTEVDPQFENSINNSLKAVHSITKYI